MTRKEKSTLSRDIGVTKKTIASYGLAPCPGCKTRVPIDFIFGEFLIRCTNPECRFYKKENRTGLI